MLSPAAARRAAPLLTPLLLLAGLAIAVTLRLAIGGNAGTSSPAAGGSFAAALLLLAAAAGWRPGRPAARTAAWGIAGATLLLAAPVLLHLRTTPALHLGSPAAGFPLWAAVITLVAVAEEALLRGALMTALLRGGARPQGAVAVAAVAFALLHVPLYGWVVLPLDLAVGVWLGGLRLRSGGAGAPAVAHTLADIATWWLR
ncbi:MAG TPA: CPBP family glutamic-type intramembrane protease [Candidatus Dormibacteraeota bacterium]|nr:CPBP family glutamic-type intramembrane protease [Candidatus Dormibacteraeota bacterium]